MMTEIYNAFRCQPFSAPSGSVPATLTITADLTSVEGENATNTANEALLLTLRVAFPQREGNCIATDEQLEAPTKLVNASYAVRPDPDAPIKIAYKIHWKLYNLTKDEIQEMHLTHKEKSARKATRSNCTTKRTIALTSCFILEKAKIDKNFDPFPKTIKTAKGGEQFKKVHIPFKFTDFRVNELDELGPIIQKKKNRTVKALMLSLGKRYERLKNIPKELGIQSALPAPAPNQALS
ncbi:hypothetical protein Tco_0349633 [Tanacetum coccineum]